MRVEITSNYYVANQYFVLFYYISKYGTNVNDS